MPDRVSEGLGAEERVTLHICPDCGEHITDPDDAGEHAFVRYGHYHDPPPDWPEDPYVEAAQVEFVPASSLADLQQERDRLRSALGEIMHVKFSSTDAMQEFARAALSTPEEEG